MACPGLLRTHHTPPLPTAATVPGGRGLSRPRAKRAPAPPVAALTDRGPSRRESPPWAMAEACAERESQRPGLVIAGRDPAIQSAAAALDGRVEPGHDERGDGRSTPASVVAFRRSPLPPGRHRADDPAGAGERVVVELRELAEDALEQAPALARRRVGIVGPPRKGRGMSPR